MSTDGPFWGLQYYILLTTTETVVTAGQRDALIRFNTTFF